MSNQNCFFRRHGMAFLLAGMSWSGLFGQSVLEQRFDFEVRNEPLARALIRLSQTAGATIGFSEALFDKPGTVSLAAQKETLSSILNRLLEGSGTGWRERGGQIVLYKKPPPEYTFSGFLEDASSGERLVGAFVLESNSGRWTNTNAYGFFSLRLPAGSKTCLSASMLGYQPGHFPFPAAGPAPVTLMLQPLVVTMLEVEVSSDSVGELYRPFFLKKEENLARLPLYQIPALGGEADLMRSAFTLPGIATGLDGLGGWSIRGGDTDQNLVLVDDAVVFNPVHGMGLFSVFNPDVVRTARLWKGDAPARLGGRAAATLDVRTREGNQQRLSGSVSLGWLAARLALEMPLQKDRGAMLFSARRSLAGPILSHFSRKTLEKDGWRGEIDYRFSDLNWKANWSFGPSDRIYLSLYDGRDYFNDARQLVFQDSFPDPQPISYTLTFQNRYDWQNRFGSFRWNHLFSDNCFVNTTLTASRFNLRAVSESGITFDLPDQPAIDDRYESLSETRLTDLSFKTDLDWYAAENLILRSGLQVSHTRVLPFFFFGNAAELNSDWVEVDSSGHLAPGSSVAYEKGLSTAWYGEAEWQPSSEWRLRAGLRAEWFANREAGWFLPQPRLSVERHWSSGWTWTASLSSMAQTLRTVSPNVLESTADLWLIAARNLPPQKTLQASTGLGWTNAAWTLRAEVFAKTMQNLEEYAFSWINYGDSLILIDPDLIVDYEDGLRTWENEIVLGRGRAAGLEVLVEKTAGRTTGWFSWTLARSLRQFDEVNQGNWFPARFDRLHQFNLVLVHRLGEHLSLSASGQVASGDAISRLLINTFSGRARLFDLHQQGLQFERLGYGDYRQTWQHRLDLGAVWAWTSGRARQQISAGCYNAYNRSNTYFTYWTYAPDGSGRQLRERVPGLPLLPYLNWQIVF